MPAQGGHPPARALKTGPFVLTIFGHEAMALLGVVQCRVILAAGKGYPGSGHLTVPGLASRRLLRAAQECLLRLEWGLAFVLYVPLCPDPVAQRPASSLVVQRHASPCTQARWAHLVELACSAPVAPHAPRTVPGSGGPRSLLVMPDQGVGSGKLQGYCEDLLLDRLVQGVGEA